MKKRNLFFLMIVSMVMVPAFLFAVNTYSPENDTYALVGQSYAATSARLTGMGGAGMGMEGYSDSFLVNPANLGNNTFKLSLPTLSITMFNPQKLLQGEFFDDLKSYLSTKSNSDATAVAEDLLKTLTQGQNEVERIDAGVNLLAGPIGFSVQAQERLFGYLENASYTSGRYVAEVTAAATLGFGMRLPLGDEFSLDLGASGQLVYRLYSQKLTSTDITNMMTDSSDPNHIDPMDDIVVMSGYAVPFKGGINLNMPFGFKVSGVVRNINGKFNYTINPSVNSWKSNLKMSEMFKGNGDFSYDEGVKYDAGVTWKVPVSGIGSFIQPTLSLDVLDFGGIKKDSSPFLAHTYAGIQARLFSFLDVRYGIAQGYQSLGLGLDLLIFHIDASYWRADYGKQYLDKSIDAVTLRFSLITN